MFYNFLQNYKLLFISILIGVFSFSCTDSIKLDLSHLPTQLVVNSVINPDSTIRVYLSQTQDFASPTSIHKYPNASIQLFEDGALVGYLTEQDSFYSMDYHPQINKEYALEIDAEGFETVYAKTRIPARSSISDSYYLFKYRYDDRESSDFTFCEITLNDPAQIENFYEIEVYKVNNYTWFSSRYDTSEVYNLQTNDPAVLAEGLSSYEPSVLLFSDQLLDGKAYQFSFEFSRFNATSINLEYLTDSLDLVLNLRNLSEEYYSFRKSWIKH